jgi:hypothetical protein
VNKKELDLIEWLLSEYEWSSPEQTRKEFIQELQSRLENKE